MVRYFCPSCWEEIPGGVDTCPYCGADLHEEAGDVVERYIAALRHPVLDRAGLACAMLAELGDPRAIAPLIALVERRPRSFDLLCSAVESLRKLHAVQAIPTLETLLHDEQAMIPARMSALEALVSFGGETAEAALAWAATCERPALRALAAELRQRASADQACAT